MSSIFIVGLEDVFRRKQLFQLRSDPGKTTVEFQKLVRVASEIATAKYNCAEAANTSVCGVSGVTHQSCPGSYHEWNRINHSCKSSN